MGRFEAFFIEKVVTFSLWTCTLMQDLENIFGNKPGTKKIPLRNKILKGLFFEIWYQLFIQE